MTSRSPRLWKRASLQLGILTGVGLSLVHGVETLAAPHCFEEGDCTYTKPLVLIALDYSTAMNTMFDADTTRWQAAVAAVQAVVDSDNGFLQGGVMLGLMRFGHDPDVDQPGTTIPGDASGLVDGHKLDVSWYDELQPDKPYFQCNGQALKDALLATPPPPAGIGAWTAGAIVEAKSLFAAAVTDHPDDFERKAALLVITQGTWSDAEATQVLQPPADDPSPVAWDMWANHAIPTYVLAVGDAQGTAEAHELAAAGGTGQAMTDSGTVSEALKAFLQSIIGLVDPPVCEPAKPRMMFLLDASSSMLNVMDDSVHGVMGATRWDLLRTAGIEQALGGVTPALGPGSAVGDWMNLGVAVFGDNAPAEQKLLVGYGECRGDFLTWALDPANSCAAPGCVDPWAGPPITWTFQTEQIDPSPGAPAPATSHVPRCDLDPLKPDACTGSGAFVHLGLELVQDEVAAAKAACLDPNSPKPCLPGTRFRNVLIMDGTYDSSDADVEAPLTQMFAAGISTYVIGLGELADDPAAVEQLTMMAAWGSGGQHDFFPAADQVGLQAALSAIFELTFTDFEVDPCCGTLACGALDESEGPGSDAGDTDPDTSTGGASSTTSDGASSTTSDGVSSTTGDAGTTDMTSGDSTGPFGTGGQTSAAPTTGGDTSGPPPVTSDTASGSAGTSGGDTSDDTDSDGVPGDSAKEGCACAADADAPGPASPLMLLALAGLGRRRRNLR